MTDYVKSTNFASKDSLAIGNPLKIVKGTEIDTEFNNIAVAVATKSDINSPSFTGAPTAPTPAAGDNTTKIATTAFVKSNVTSPTFGGTTTVDVLSLNTSGTGWTIDESADVVYFKHNGVNKAKLDSSGNLTVAGNVTAYGSV